MRQATLFETEKNLPGGFAYRPEFLTKEEEAELLDWFLDLPFEHSRSGEYEARRRHISFGWQYDFKHERLIPGPPLPPFLKPSARKVAKWLDIPHTSVVEALITEYPPGSAIGWHRDNEKFDAIAGVSLSGWSRLRLRPLRRTQVRRDPKAVVSIELAPRSVYIMQRESRWNFQHSIAPVEALRYSITFRTLMRRS